MNLSSIVSHLDDLLRIGEINDWSGAVNGLQIENSSVVTKIGASVDATLPVLEKAVAEGVDLLLVHHGLFWAGVQPLRGAVYRKFKVALDNNLALYSAHLPLDLHPTLGNNALLAQALGFVETVPFFSEKGQLIGLRIQTEIRRDELAEKLAHVLGSCPHLAPGGSEICRQIGIVTGGAGGEVARAAGEGVDTFITGEGPNHSFGLAEELEVNLFYGGHYATETFGVKALATHLSGKYGLPWVFIDHPTGL